MTNIEHQGLSLILQKLKNEDLSSLAKTTTKGLIKVDDKNNYGKIEIILKYTEKSSLLLRRRKLKKEYIFNYLHDQGVSFPISSDKSEYIKSCLKHWESPEYGQDLSFDDTLDDEDVIMEEVEYENTSVITTEEAENGKLRSMGQTFITWFFDLLKEGMAGPEHFWPDASLRIGIEDTEQNKLGLFSNANDVSHFLRNLCCFHQILLDPNISGIKSMFDAYGMVTVGVYGVIHKNHTCIGLFNQDFGLVKDPRQEDSWKIKFTNLKMKINCALIKHILPLYQLKNV